jgi:2-polyprenyl-3-methyl-5-hydroxy-6-metoxy-1,4-benzoquinol methylase
MTNPADPARIAALWDSHARRWDQIYSDSGAVRSRTWDRFTRQNVRRRFERCFSGTPDLNGKTVLDLGCGTGRFLDESLRRGARRVLGVDLSPAMIQMARGLLIDREWGAKIELRCCDLMGLALDERFDLVIAMGLFDYLDDPEAVIAPAATWCRGVFVASFPHRVSIRWAPRMLYWRRRGINPRFYSKREIQRLADSAGFRGSRIERIGPVYLLRALAADPSR